MRKIFVFALLAIFATSVNASPKKDAKKNNNKPVFTVIKENPIPSIKDHNRSGTCWDYSTLSYFEA
ncbi:UNVERIFIED_CONTAM: aminopeptidase, partial [Prevotella sp. 15_C9]